MVLGGGDGGVLKELLELSHPPEYITMIELDNEVMTGCAKYMRSVCGNYLDEGNRKGSNYEVICGDALKYMENAIVCTLIQLNRYELRKHGFLYATNLVIFTLYRFLFLFRR